MSRGVNKAIIVGRLGQDPETRYTTSGTAVCNLSVATSYKRGEEEQTEWHRVVMFSKLAEIAGQYLKKGGQVYIEGYLQTRKWQDQSGADRYSTEIVAQEMQMLGDSTGSNNRSQGNSTHNNDGTRKPPQRPPEESAPGGGQADDFDSIPFAPRHFLS